MIKSNYNSKSFESLRLNKNTSFNLHLACSSIYLAILFNQIAGANIFKCVFILVASGCCCFSLSIDKSV